MTPGKCLIVAAGFLLLLLLVALPESLPITTGREGKQVLLGVLALAAAGAGSLAYFGHRRLVDWTSRVAARIETVNRGELSTQLPTAETAGQAAKLLHKELDGFLGHFRSTIGNLQQCSATVATMSAYINDNSARLVGAVETQANSAIDATTTVSEISSSIEKTVEDIEILTRSSEEVSSSIMEMTASVEEVALSMNRLLEAIDQVGASIAEMTASIHEIDGNLETLNANTQNAVSSTVQMDHSICQVQESVQSAVGTFISVLQDAEAGRKAVEASIVGTRQMHRSSQIALDAIGDLSKRAASIDAIIGVINELADQTNLLALNASIIAAQSGVHGRSFSVVAEEIKDLAQKTKNSTHEISEIISGVQSETRRVDEVIRTTEVHVREGVELSTFSGEALEKIVAGVKHVNDQVVMIARTTEEQADGSKNIRMSMENIASMVSQIAVATREQSATSDLIHSSSENMRNLASQVNSATREQSAASSVIANLAETMRNLTGNARSSCKEQLARSGKVHAAVEVILETSDLNLDIARVMDEAVEKLGQNAQELERASDFSA